MTETDDKSLTFTPVQISINQYGVAITPNERYLYIVNNQYYGINPNPYTISILPLIISYDRVYLYDLINEQIITTIIDSSFKTPSTATISNGRVYITNSNSTTISVIDMATNKVSRTIDGLENPYRIVISADGKTGFVCNYGNGTMIGTVSVVNLQTFAIIKNISVGKGPCNCALTADGKKLCVVNYDDKTISIIDITSFIVVKTITLNSNVGSPFNINIDSNNNCYILSISFLFSHISIIDLSTNTLLLPYSSTPGIWYGIVFPSNPSLKQLYILYYNKNTPTTISFIDINNGIPQLILIQYKDDYQVNYYSTTIKICQEVGNAILTYDKKFLYISNYSTAYRNINNLLKL